MSEHGATAARDSYDPYFYDRLFAAEERHFWFRARNRVIVAMVRQLLASFPENCRILEVGCGTGNVLRALEPVCPPGSLTGMDLFDEGLRFARARTRCSLVKGDLYHPPFDNPFHLIGMFDVLEHLEADDQALRALHQLLLPTGLLFLTVPARPELWSYFDQSSCHQRRYTVADLSAKLANAGYRLEFVSQFMMALYPLIWAGRRLASSRRRPGEINARELTARELKIVPVFNQLMFWLLSAEAPWLAARRRLPLGSSILALARKTPKNGN